jgi:hypothetical protein
MTAISRDHKLAIRIGNIRERTVKLLRSLPHPIAPKKSVTWDTFGWAAIAPA